MKKILGLSTLALAGVLAFTGCSCNKGMSEEEALKYAEEQGYVKVTAPAALPAARKDSATCDVNSTSTQYSKGCSGVSAANLKEYLGREDIEYIDVRDTGSVGTNLTNYSAGHLKGFKLVEYFAYVVGNENQLFFKSGSIVDPDDSTKTIPTFSPRYIDSVETLKDLFPQDKTLFIMCAGGSRVVPLMQLLDQYGWDMSKVYNVGGWSDYSTNADYKDYRVGLGADTKFSEYEGTAQGSSQGNTTLDLSATVKVLYNADLDVVGGGYLVSGDVASSGYQAAVKAEVYKIFDSITGLSADEVKAKLTSNGNLAEGTDVVAGATNSTKLIYKAIIAALPAAE